MQTHRLSLLIVFALGSTALAELQNVSVEGQVRIRARHWENVYVDGGREIRIPDYYLPGRPIGPFGAASRYGYDEDGNRRTWVEQSTRLKFSADFTDYVSAVIEFDDFEIWGQGDFRSDYVTGVDSRANSTDDVELLQGYIETNETAGLPLRLRIGRQQIMLGNGWLVGENQSTMNIAFDGLRATYNGANYTLDGWATKLSERGVVEADGDVDFYGLSASYSGLEEHEFLAYWLLTRDARSQNDTNFIVPIERLEDAIGLDDYDASTLHTAGIRMNGTFGHFDYDAEVAYQFGEVDALGAGFAPPDSVYGDDGARANVWGGDAEVGYTYEKVSWAPRVYLGGAYFGGEDNRGLSFLEWLNPFDRPNASVSFNRLFSAKRYYEVFDEGRNGTNFYQIRTGVEVGPTERVSLVAEIARLGVNAPFEYPVSVDAGPFRIPVAPTLAFLTEESGNEIGTVTRLQLHYDYSDNLSFKLSWDHLFASDEVNTGSFVFSNGLELLAGSDSDDAEYIEFESRLRF